MKKFILIICAFTALCACSTKRRIVTETEQHSVEQRQQTRLQTQVLIDSMLQTVSISADSVTILVTPPPRDSLSPTVRLTAHQPKVKAEKKRHNLAVAHTAERDSTASKTTANIHADTSKEVVGVARPMNGTLVIVLLAVLLIAAIVLLLYLRKHKII